MGCDRRNTTLIIILLLGLTVLVYQLMINHLTEAISLKLLDNRSSVKSTDQRETKLVKTSQNALRNIPKKIFMAVKDTSRATMLSIKTKSWRQSNYEIVIMNNDQQSEWIKTNYPNLHPIYQNFNYDIQKSDFWRFMILYHHGGFYFDSDVVLRQPIDEWYTLNDTNGREINVLLGIEGNTKKELLAHKPAWREQQILSWTLATIPRHPLFEHFLGIVLNKPIRPRNPASYTDDVADFASPAILTDAVHSYLLLKDIKLSDLFDKGGNQFAEDIYLAEVNAFACGTMWSIGAIKCETNTKRIKVQHMFAGSWRNSHT